MVFCPSCGSSQVFVDITRAIRLIATPVVLGDRAKVIYDSIGMVYSSGELAYPKLEERESIKKIRVGPDSPGCCSECGFQANLSQFRNKDQCRCGVFTEKLEWCFRYGILVCNKCLDPYSCNSCSTVRCVLHPENETGGYAKLFESKRRRSA